MGVFSAVLGAYIQKNSTVQATVKKTNFIPAKINTEYYHIVTLTL